MKEGDFFVEGIRDAIKSLMAEPALLDQQHRVTDMPTVSSSELAVLKHRADEHDRRMARVEDKLDKLIEVTGRLPTTSALWTIAAAVGTIALAVVALVVATQGNTLSSFSNGLSAFQAHLASTPPPTK